MKRTFITLLSLMGLLILLNACSSHQLKYAKLETMLEDAVADSAWPGGVLFIGQGNKIVFNHAAGYHTYEQKIKIKKNDIFDLASVSKVIGTTSAVMKLVENGEISLNDKAVKYLPELKGPDKKNTELKKEITIKHLLTHSAGFEPFRLFYEMDCSVEARWDSVYQSELQSKPGDKTVYSDIGLMCMGKIVEKVTTMSQDAYLRKIVYDPLKMADTHYNPDPSLIDRIVPTEYIDNKLVHGYVHDENTHSLGGVAGHAGLFSTVADLSVFSRMMLNEGELNGIRIFKPETIKQFTTPLDESSSRCLGWDSPGGESSGGIYLSPYSYGHTGFTGTSIWIDPENDVYVILLTNAVHPDRSYKNPKYYDWRQLLHSAAYEELGLNKRNPDLFLKKRWVKEFNMPRKAEE
ncbi:MAG: serine hydrolase [Candidatus Neomarinimicrobiota bacterium]|jgi:CubicO group peptidase (beta-lactamase class C family)